MLRFYVRTKAGNESVVYDMLSNALRRITRKGKVIAALHRLGMREKMCFFLILMSSGPFKGD